MESNKPADKNIRLDTRAAAPLPLHLSTPDPQEATKPVRIVANKPAARSEITQAAPVLAPKLEDTKPVQIHAALAATAPVQTPEPGSTQTEELPAWLVAFARAETPGEAPVDPKEDTKTVQIQRLEAQFDEEPSRIPLTTPSLLTADNQSGWTLESNLEPVTRETEVESPSEPVEPENTAELPEDLPENKAPRSEEIASESSDGAEASLEPPGVPKDNAPKNAQELAFAAALDEGSLSEARAILMATKKDPAARAGALSVLRSRLDMRAESQPLWEFYAELCSADNQPGLARQAQETAEKLKNAPGE